VGVRADEIYTYAERHPDGCMVARASPKMLRIVCGITGVLDWERPADPAVVRAMMDALRHRGPDAEGLVARGPMVLGHRRLSIIDLSSAGNQPMCDASGQFWLVFNGEIYNFLELRRELEARGIRFRTRTDTEVILESYKCWGPDCVQRFNGMFAFALWDERQEHLMLARDRLGKKPLYFQRLGNAGIVFASELKALRLHPRVGSSISPVALGHFLSVNYTLTKQSILEGVEKLPAASYLLVSREGLSTPVGYWDLAAAFREKPQRGSVDETADELAALIDDAVRLRLISDVPLGAFLSGGLDSAIVVAAMSRAHSAKSTHTFNIDFKEETYSEGKAAAETARYLAVNHRDRTAALDVQLSLEAMIKATDEPFADTSIVPTLTLAQFAREHVTVALSGDGGDEIFAGYETYVADRLRHMIGWMPGWVTASAEDFVKRFWPVSYSKVSTDYKVKQFLAGRRAGADRAHYSWREIFSREDKNRLLRPEWRSIAGADTFADFKPHFDAVGDCHYLDRAMYADIKTWLVDDILVKVDRATMAYSLEARAPLLDYRVVEFAASLPVDWKLRGLKKKYLLKRSQTARLPANIIDRPKSGFGAPVSHWLSGALGDVALEVTHDPSMTRWFELSEIDAMWTEHRERRRDHGLRLFGLTCLGLWMNAT
jgi:asparagine synthase (glutamine-hydrolysing)